MIKLIGQITLSNGLIISNTDINVCVQDSDKFTPTIGYAQPGKVIPAVMIPGPTEGEPEIVGPPERFELAFNGNIGAYNYVGPNPSFEEVQATVLAGLQADYPTVTFEIVK
jgi:hypothetical protein